MKRVGIIGFGQFGQFAAKHLSKYAEVKAYDAAGGDSPILAPLQDVCAADYLIFAVPVQNLEAACKEAAPYIETGVRIIDVASVKVTSLQILQKYFPHNEILGAHPIFGPQSGKDGIAGLPIVLSNVSWSSEHYASILSFLSEQLELKVIEKTPEEHDKEMAKIQGLTHFIGRALNALDIQTYDTATKSYQQLVELRGLLKNDSWELFKTIQNENPYAAQVRKDFLHELADLEGKLEEECK